MHSSSFTTATLSIVIAPTGHSSAHIPHATQHPSSTFAGMREYAIVIFIDIARGWVKDYKAESFILAC